MNTILLCSPDIIMERNQTIEQVLEGLGQDSVKKSVASPLVGIVLILFGVSCVIINSIVPAEAGSILSPLLIMLTIAFIIWGLLKAFIRKTIYTDLSKNQKIRFTEIFYDNKDHDKLIRIVTTGAYDEIASVRKSTQDGVKLRVASTPDKSICYVQVLTYIPYEYALSTEAIKLTGDQTEKLFASVHL
ncbi:MAG: hypothetical protein H6Q20_1174 [Bacteroidetes bacterium]|nr:hypothetical protein [Bacteroidota bacterium]